jgi:hypothetical protein
MHLAMHLAAPRRPLAPRSGSKAGISQHPIGKEHSVVVGGLGESVAGGRHKHIGQLFGIDPLRQDDLVQPTLIVVYKASYAHNGRMEQHGYRVFSGHIDDFHTFLPSDNARSFLCRQVREAPWLQSGQFPGGLPNNGWCGMSRS